LNSSKSEKVRLNDVFFPGLLNPEFKHYCLQLLLNSRRQILLLLLIEKAQAPS